MEKTEPEIIVDDDGTEKVAIPVESWEKIQCELQDLETKVDVLESATILADRIQTFDGVPMREALESLRKKLNIPSDA